eukprot:CAMPEP_0180660190 /NCGR_PEP_ID=MMETSP1037_2-20121125/58084_1 /TAXON_ID=632150 /ORGANISM="Azadinium spinosum, Strain 3D9" /LENGTH=45 /DNA_ID= /DNA_START= /DNA_END= /DNA_ORIENTATION=
MALHSLLWAGWGSPEGAAVVLRGLAPAAALDSATVSIILMDGEWS